MSRVEPNRNVYVGHRYVPKIFGEWDKKNQYEGLSIVTHQGNSYTSKKRVPVGIDILNEEYWVVTGNYNAQVEEYRKETERVAKDLLLKSDKTYVDTELGKKADKTYVDTELGKKANKTYVDTELDKKANKTYVDTELGKKANKTYVDTELDKVNDTLDFNNEKSINVKINGAVGNGVTNDTLNIQSVLNENPGSVIVFPPGHAFKVDYLDVPDNTTLIGYGSKLFNKTRHDNILNLGNGCKIFGFEIEGYGSETLVYDGIGINILGEFNSNTNKVEYKKDIIIKDCYIHDFGGYGIYTEYAENVIIDKSYIENIGYAGIHGFSVKDIHTSNSTIKGILGNGLIGYNIAYSMRSHEVNINKYPKSRDCSAVNCLIEDNNTWEGLDTHGGINILFEGNTIKNCKIGIAMVGASGVYAPTKVSVINNTIYGSGNGSGIVIAGARDDSKNTLEYCDNSRVIGNMIYESGEEGNSLNGGIRLSDTKGVIVNSNTLENNFVNGILLYINNIGYNVNGNNIVDVQSSTQDTTGISIRDINNTGIIGGNNILLNDPDKNVYVGNIGIRRYIETDNKITLSPNNITTLSTMNGLGSGDVNYGEIGIGKYLLSGTGTPVGKVQANVGSMYLAHQPGNSDELLFLKTGGNINSWKPVNVTVAGATSIRPENPVNGQMFYDTQIRKPIWYFDGWKDSEGVEV